MTEGLYYEPDAGPGRAGDEGREPYGDAWKLEMFRKAEAGLRAARGFAGLPPMPEIVCLCGSSRFYDEYQQAYYERTMAGEIVLSIGFYPHAQAEHGHGEGVGHDSAQKVMLDELHKRKIDLADYVLVVSGPDGYFGSSTASEIAYAVRHGKPVRFDHETARDRALGMGLIQGTGAAQ